MELQKASYDFNCPKYVDFFALPTEDDGADEWFDIHQDHEEYYDKENKIRLFTPKKNFLPSKRGSMDKTNLKAKRVSVVEQKAKRISVGGKKTMRRSVPLRVLRRIEHISTDDISQKINSLTLKPLPEAKMRNFSRISLPKQVEETETTIEMEKESKDFIASLRNSTERAPKTSNNQRLLMTKPQPFKLTESKRDTANCKVFRSVAEQLVAFQKKTPAPANFKPPTGKVVPLRPTVPMTPKLQTQNRSRPSTAKSREEEESIVLQDIRKQQFKHKPFDPKLFAKPVIKKVEVKITKPKPFNLTVVNPRLRRSLSMETFKTEFRAKPVPAGLFDGPKGLGQFKEIPLTDPKSPAFAQRYRSERCRSTSSDRTADKTQPKLLTSISSASGIPNIKWNKRATLIEPFSFDNKDKERFSKKDEKIKEIVEQEKKLAEFHAHPMPDLSVVKIPEKQVRPLTEILPFKFIRENSGVSRMENMKREVQNSEMEEEIEKQRVMANFKAGPNRVIYVPPFIPEKSNKKLTNVCQFDLHTEQRSMNRVEYDVTLKLKEARIEALRRELELKQQQEERLALMELRKNAVLKANPVRRYKQVV
uniref:TPX2 C-terminal domain-containing protein n=1 Tax=Strigamia maritima TaxID=126957 RepID=T1J533_STRMM